MRTDPFRDLDRMAQQLLGTNARPASMPMDAYRQGDTFFVHFDIPGTDPGKIDLTVEQNVLTVHAERTGIDHDAEMIVAERPVGTFTRQIFLGDTLNAEEIVGDYEAGVLTLRIPVREQAKPRKIDIGSHEPQALTVGGGRSS
jgi:HSP20 family protein